MTIHKLLTMALALATLACASGDRQNQTPHDSGQVFPVPAIDYQPRQYLCYRSPESITIDGYANEAAWLAADWTASFVDIEGNSKPTPRFNTRAKMLWDSTYFYVAAQMEEPHLWATLTERDAVIYHDNDFEVFIDPDGDSHEYYELEINAFGTEWDLLLIKPYRDGAPAVNAWDIQGLKTAIALQGSLNDPSDRDSGWSVEIAIPWEVLTECAHRPSPPVDGDTWWVNFSRVQWQLDTSGGVYTKQTDSTGEKSLPENNWVWSPQGLIAMHYPEMWGLVQFSDKSIGNEPIPFVPPVDLEARWALRQFYYAQRQYEADHNRFAASTNEIEANIKRPAGFQWPPELSATGQTFVATTVSSDGLWMLTINHEGRLMTKKHKVEGQ